MTEFTYRKGHLECFQQSARPGTWPESPFRKWADSVGLPGFDHFSEHARIGRAELTAMAADPACPNRDVLWSILGWGKMRVVHARTVARNEGRWIEVVSRLRRGDLSRADGYALCHDTMTGIEHPGIGPAYFTKLIFFADPKHEGYIMDQWTSRSSNLLVDGPPIVRMLSRAYVSPNNGPETYETYCRLVEDLSRRIERSPEETEQCLFSRGGKEPDTWRTHVLDCEERVQVGQRKRAGPAQQLHVKSRNETSLRRVIRQDASSIKNQKVESTRMPFSPEELARVLIPAAMERKTMTYKDLGISLGRTDRAPWRGLGKSLYNFQDWAREMQLPPLSLLVVNKLSGRPSTTGYYFGKKFSDMSSEEIENLQEECFTFSWPSNLLKSLGLRSLDKDAGPPS